MSVRVQKSSFMVMTLGHYNFGPNVVSETLELYISSGLGGHGIPRKATGGPLVATEASSRTQILPQITNLSFYQHRQDP